MDYFNTCELPKIESKLEAEAISVLKDIMNVMPYAYELKETEDIIMIIKHLYNFIEYKDSQDFSNMGYALGAIAYDLKCMYNGESTLGFVSVGENLTPDAMDQPRYSNMSVSDLALYNKQHDV